MFFGILHILILTLLTAFASQRPQTPPASFIPGAGVSVYEVDPNLLVCSFAREREETCHTERLDAAYIALSHLTLYRFCRLYRWGYVPYRVQVRYARSPTGQFLAEIKASSVSGTTTISLRGHGDDPIIALRAAHLAAFIAPASETL